MAQPALDRLAFAAVLRMHDYLRSGFARTCGRLVVRAIIDDENMIELLPYALDDVADVLLLAIRRNDRSDCRSIRFVNRPGWNRRTARVAAPLFHCQRTTG